MVCDSIACGSLLLASFFSADLRKRSRFFRLAVLFGLLSFGLMIAALAGWVDKGHRAIDDAYNTARLSISSVGLIIAIGLSFFGLLSLVSYKLTTNDSEDRSHSIN